jgi:hypothetical protein
MVIIPIRYDFPLLFNIQHKFKKDKISACRFTIINKFTITIIYSLNTLQEERKSLKERLQAIQEVTFTVQKAVGYIASSVESVKKSDFYQ